MLGAKSFLNSLQRSLKFKLILYRTQTHEHSTDRQQPAPPFLPAKQPQLLSQSFQFQEDQKEYMGGVGSHHSESSSLPASGFH